jgi:hypothetical protein
VSKTTVLLALLMLGASSSSSELTLPRVRNKAQAPGWLSFDELVSLARSVGFSMSAATYAARIAWRESGGNPRAQNLGNTPGRKPSVERSFGLWQINTLANRQYDETSLMDPSYNARAAYELSHQGTSWRPWNLP